MKKIIIILIIFISSTAMIFAVSDSIKLGSIVEESFNPNIIIKGGEVEGVYYSEDINGLNADEADTVYFQIYQSNTTNISMPKPAFYITITEDDWHKTTGTDSNTVTISNLESDPNHDSDVAVIPNASQVALYYLAGKAVAGPLAIFQASWETDSDLAAGTYECNVTITYTLT